MHTKLRQIDYTLCVGRALIGAHKRRDILFFSIAPRTYAKGGERCFGPIRSGANFSLSSVNFFHHNEGGPRMREL
jgi:hypothetical protein